MKPDSSDERKIAVTDFKPRCLTHIRDVAKGRIGRILLTRHGHSVAAIVAAPEETPARLWGALRGQMSIAVEFDPDG